MTGYQLIMRKFLIKFWTISQKVKHSFSVQGSRRFGSVNWKKIVPKTGGDADQENEIYLTFLKLR